MKCPFCGYEETKVIDSRPAEENEKIRRRRECVQCEKRFTTFEIIESIPVMVVKKNNLREPFDRTKLMNGLLRAFEKRPTAIAEIDHIITEIEASFYNNMEREVTSSRIGELVMEKIKNIDEVAYIRFASVYRDFKDMESFVKAINILRG